MVTVAAGRPPEETTKIVLAQLDAWIAIDKAMEDMQHAYHRLVTAQRKLLEGNRVAEHLEGIP